MKKLFIFIVIVLNILSGCSISNENYAPHSTDYDQNASSESDQPVTASQVQAVEHITLTFQPHHSNQEIREVDQLESANIIREQEVFDGKILIYSTQGDSEYIYGAYITEDKLFDLGIVGGTHEGVVDELISIEYFKMFDRSLVCIKGVFGSNAPVQNYFAVEEGEITPFIRVDTGNASEIDLDRDGTIEIISSHGANIQTYIYIWNEGDFYVANVNKALDATSVYINDEKQLVAFYDTDTPNKVFTYDSGILKLAY